MPSNKTSVPSRKEFAKTKAATKQSGKSAPACATQSGARSMAKAKATKIQKTVTERITDADRLNTFVVSVLEKWRLAKENNLDGTDQNIIKISMRDITLIMQRQLKNTRVARLHDLINDTLSGLDIADVYGSWVFVDWDSPDCLFIRLPDTKTKVVRARIGRTKGSDDYQISPATEQLIEHGLCSDDEEIDGDEESPDYTVKSDAELRALVERFGLNTYGAEGNESVVDINSYDRDALIRLLVESDDI
jgi:hypothetical protein